MALINCPECTKEISNAAPACLNCGFPIRTAEDVHAVGTPLTTIQETSKKLKLHMLISVMSIIIGVVWMIGEDDALGGASLWPALLVGGGLFWYVVIRFQIWWHHK